MVVNIGYGFDQYCVKLIMVQDKETDTAIDRHEGEYTTLPILSANAPKQNTFAIDSSDINKSLDPTAATNWRLCSIKRYTLESRPSHPPLPSQPSVMTKLHCWMNFNLWNISKGESFLFHCAYACPKINHVML
jgi:hypothetical protein